MDAAGELAEEIVNCLDTLESFLPREFTRTQTGGRRPSS